MTSTARACNSILNRIDRIGEARNGFLIGLAIVYGLGYAVRSLYAWQVSLGVMPALDSQYFLAGVMPALVCVFVVGAFIAARRLVAWMVTLNSRSPRGFRVVTLIVLLLGVALLVMSMALEANGHFLWPFEGIGHYCGSLGTYRSCMSHVRALLLLSVSFYAQTVVFGAAIAAGKFGRHFRARAVYKALVRGYMLIAVMYSSAGTLALSYAGYRNLPQELGGLRPELVRLDVVDAELSPPLRVELALPEVDTSPAVRRSDTLQLLSAQGDYLIVRPVSPLTGAIEQHSHSQGHRARRRTRVTV